MLHPHSDFDLDIAGIIYVMYDRCASMPKRQHMLYCALKSNVADGSMILYDVHREMPRGRMPDDWRDGISSAAASLYRVCRCDDGEAAGFVARAAGLLATRRTRYRGAKVVGVFPAPAWLYLLGETGTLDGHDSLLERAKGVERSEAAPMLRTWLEGGTPVAEAVELTETLMGVEGIVVPPVPAPVHTPYDPDDEAPF